MFRVLLLIFLLLAACDTESGQPDNDRDDPEPADNSRITGEFVQWEPVDDARGYAYFTVTNSGSGPGVAECTIKVSNDFGNFGFDYMVGEELAPGETQSFRMPIDVGEGSALINAGEVTDC